MKKTLQILFYLIVSTALTGGCFLLPKETKQEKVELLKPPQDRLTYVKAFKGRVEKVLRKSAKIGSLKEEFLYFKQNGRIADIYVKYGDMVKNNQVLAVIEEEDIEFHLSKQKLLLEKSRLRLDQIKSEAALGKYSSSDVRSAAIDYEIVKLEYDHLLETFKDKTLRAPFDGKITSLKAKVGEPITAYEDIVRVTNLDELDLIFTAKSGDIADLELNQAVEVEIKKNKWITGKITHVPSANDKLKDGSPDRNVLVELKDKSLEFTYGRICSIKVIIDFNEEALQVAKKGVRKYFDTYTARVKNPETGAITEAELVLGIEGDSTWEVLSGLEEGDMVISK